MSKVGSFSGFNGTTIYAAFVSVAPEGNKINRTDATTQ
jgi:hypothetical protein